MDSCPCHLASSSKWRVHNSKHKDKILRLIEASRKHTSFNLIQFFFHSLFYIFPDKAKSQTKLKDHPLTSQRINHELEYIRWCCIWLYRKLLTKTYNHILDIWIFLLLKYFSRFSIDCSWKTCLVHRQRRGVSLKPKGESPAPARYFLRWWWWCIINNLTHKRSNFKGYHIHEWKVLISWGQKLLWSIILYSGEWSYYSPNHFFLWIMCTVLDRRTHHAITQYYFPSLFGPISLSFFLLKNRFQHFFKSPNLIQWSIKSQVHIPEVFAFLLLY